MDKKRQEGYVTGVVCLVIFFVFFILAINNAWNISGQILWVFTFIFGGLGVGSLWKPDSIGAVVSQFLRNFAESAGEEKSDSDNKQIQKKSSGSVQVMAHEGAEVNINVPRKQKQPQSSTMAKTFSCSRGHENTVYPPDDNHPLASLEEDHARKNAIGTVIPMQCKCRKKGCESQFTLYWYKGRIAARFG